MQGITVYARPGRATWYVTFYDPNSGKRLFRNSGFRLDDGRGKLKAYAFAREQSQSGIGHHRRGDPDEWHRWVPDWLATRYRTQPRTLTAYTGAWNQLATFLAEAQVPCPRLLEYRHVVDFVHWRESQVKKQSGRRVSRNTALHNVKVLSRLMREAIRRGYAQGNPCTRLGEDVPAEPPPEKPEFTDEQIGKVRAELARRAGLGRPSDWMAIAFEIAIHQGCRLSACQIPLDQIDLERGTITFREKGSRGRKTEFTAPLHPGLRPLIERLKAEGRTVTCTLPFHAPRNFSRVMKAMGLPHTFHSTRVSVITRMARGDVTQQKAMAYVHHGSWAVHKIYTKLKAPDVAGVATALAIPAVAAPRADGHRPRKTPGADPAKR